MLFIHPSFAASFHFTWIGKVQKYVAVNKNNVFNFAALFKKKNHDNMGTYSEDDKENIHHINKKKSD